MDNYRNEYSPFNASDARFEYKELCKSNNTNFRKYVTGSKYKNLYPNSYNVINDANFTMRVELEDKTITTIKVRTFSNDDEFIQQLKSFCTTNFKDIRHGNCRIKSGDGGIMNVIGMNRKLKRGYNINKDLATDLNQITSAASQFYTKHFQAEAKSMVDESLYHKRIDEMENCIVSEFLVSKDLINACHVDCFDKSYSITTWVEEIEGNAKGWNFVLPNITSDGEKGTIIPLTHGKTISWDGRKIYHCSRVGDMASNNNVYGFFFGVK